MGRIRGLEKLMPKREKREKRKQGTSNKILSVKLFQVESVKRVGKKRLKTAKDRYYERRMIQVKKSPSEYEVKKSTDLALLFMMLQCVWKCLRE
ncbi:hypothetical protein TNIN_429521 [Trichonephila inaurata madagascariensis]|uniref:Uncharacterized protein n=1 Tax=Trichonephila inaurata madagascariensis TaxID=2747483 RepID=A0A8X7C8T0_9ARAC|nr:hypothetical protein TNIN_429521 [Trichonephila inaurata madagascariensis]